MGVEMELLLVFFSSCRRRRRRGGRKAESGETDSYFLFKVHAMLRRRLIGVLLLREGSPRALLEQQLASSVENVRRHALKAASSCASIPGALGGEARIGSSLRNSSSTAAATKEPPTAHSTTTTANSTSASPSSSSPSATTFPRPTFDLSESLRECPSDHVITLNSSNNEGKPITMTISLSAGAALAPAAGDEFEIDADDEIVVIALD